MRHLLLIDGTNMLMRCASVVCHAEPSTDPRVQRKVLDMTIGMALKACRAVDASHVIIALDDSDYPSERKSILPTYKHSRTGKTAHWVALARQAFARAGLWCVTAPGWEADDVCATFATRAPSSMRVSTLSGDSDLLSLIGTCEVWQYGLKTINEPQFVVRDDQWVHDKYSVLPYNLINLKALAGEPGDDVEGPFGKHCVAAALKCLRAVMDLEGDPIANLIEMGALTGREKEAALLARNVLHLRTALALDPVRPSQCLVPTDASR